MSLAEKVSTVTYNFAFLIVKIILLEKALLLSPTAADKTHYFVYLYLNFILKLINDIPNDFQKLLEYFNGTAIVAFLQFLFAPSVSVFPKNIALSSKYLQLLSLGTSALKLVASSLGYNHKLPIVSKNLNYILSD